jgi:hypothetical protein
VVSNGDNKITIGVLVSDLEGGSEFIAYARVFFVLSKSDKSYIASLMYGVKEFRNSLYFSLA